MSEEVDELLEAVDALTKPTKEQINQTDDNGKWIRKHTVNLPPLLDRLEAAIASSTSGKAGGGNPASRAVLNSDALYQSVRITSAITDWCHIEKATPARDANTSLRRWYAKRLEAAHRDNSWYIARMWGWVRAIGEIITPPRKFPLTVPCIACGATDWVNEDGHLMPYPLYVEYEDREADILSTAKAMCRSCEKVWRGSRELRELRFDIDTKESA